MAKRRNPSGDITDGECLTPGKSPKKGHNTFENERLQEFISWCENERIKLNPKVKISKKGSCAQYGLIAIEDIKEGETLVEIPRDILLTPTTSFIAEIVQNSAEIKGQSGWVQLLICLMYEYAKPDSRWAPYFRLVPEFGELKLPMFWEKPFVDNLLKGTGVAEAVQRDLENISQDFENVVLPFVKKYSCVFLKQCEDINFYKKMVAFVMAYSFTEPLNLSSSDLVESETDDENEQGVASPPMMVPVADILNHVAKNNAELQFGKDVLSMVATTDISEDEEIFNTYGQLANCQLLHMYGFAEAYPNNHNDTVDIPMNFLYQLQLKGTGVEESKLVKQKWKFIKKKLGILSEEGMFVIGVDGVLTEEEMYIALNVMNMSAKEFLEYKISTGSSDDGFEEVDEVNEGVLSFVNVPKLPETWRQVISQLVHEVLHGYKSSLQEEEALMENETWSNLDTQGQFSCYVRYGQKQILHKLLDACDLSETPFNEVEESMPSSSQDRNEKNVELTRLDGEEYFEYAQARKCSSL